MFAGDYFLSDEGGPDTEASSKVSKSAPFCSKIHTIGSRRDICSGLESLPEPGYFSLRPLALKKIPCLSRIGSDF